MEGGSAGSGAVQQTLPYPPQSVHSHRLISVTSSPARPVVQQPLGTAPSPHQPAADSLHTSAVSSPPLQPSPQSARSLHEQIAWSNDRRSGVTAGEGYSAAVEQQLQQRIAELQAANQQLQNQVADMSGKADVRLQEAEVKTSALQADLEQVRWRGRCGARNLGSAFDMGEARYLGSGSEVDKTNALQADLEQVRWAGAGVWVRVGRRCGD